MPDNRGGVKILLVDDDADDRDFFQIAADDSDYHIECSFAKSPAAAFTFLKESDTLPDFIFLDLNMPQIDGKACLEQLKREELTAKIPVVMFSTSSNPRHISETRELGAIDFITKPPGIDELRANLNNFLKNHLHI